MTYTQDPASGGQTATIPAPPTILSGQEVYDMIMGKIEPELVTNVLPLLKEHYKDETPEDAKLRAERYQKAFAEYDKQYAEYQKQMEGVVHTYQRQVVKGAEAVEEKHESAELQNLESAISES